ncbi:hypothetical protein GCM10011583_11810 [Streptomyces camponoticapitis]|uniref:DUF6292 domain-containing protein n=1 Tax=Streptomyces camponoticapitis TaxID=1616125 RepID=A0ABQ2DZF8_9ACTN|nr:DUF6292 family protein [Streptomyces camponoticapitis]GGJ81961.1 hypothetical protein GCM10011583_11810 [Streptomyces camponoticapitis]
MATTDPHHSYIQAVQHTLGDLHDPAESWTEYASDNGEVMLMETAIRINRHADEEWPEPVFLFWDQVHGWTWAYETEPGRNSDPLPLLTGPLVPDPVDVARAVSHLLNGTADQLPLPNCRERPYSDTEPIALTPALTEALGDGTDDNPGNIDHTGAVALAAYADPVRAMTDALAAAGLSGATAAPDVHDQSAVTVRMTPAAGRALGRHLGVGPEALFPMALWDVGVRPIGGAHMPHGITLHLDAHAAGRLTALLRQPPAPGATNKMINRDDNMRDSQMSEQVNVRVLLLVGDQAEVVADAGDAGEPARYPAVEISEAVGVPVRELPGVRLTADVGAGDRLSGWRLR